MSFTGWLPKQAIFPKLLILILKAFQELLGQFEWGRTQKNNDLVLDWEVKSVKRQNSKQIKAIAFILIEFTLPILFGLIDPALEQLVSTYLVTWEICQVLQEEEEQE